MTAWEINGPDLTQALVERQRINGVRLPLVVRGHQGTGDHVLCNGLYRTLAEDWNLEILCLEKNAQTVRLMLTDLPSVRLIPMPQEAMLDQYCAGITNKVILRLGASVSGFDRWKFDREFYRQAQVPMEYRWSKAIFPDVLQVSAPAYKYSFVHDRPDFNNARLNMPGIRPDPKHSIFAHRNLILGAAELHCVSSAFAVYADSLPLNGAKLCFYPFGREIPALKHPWAIK